MKTIQVSNRIIYCDKECVQDLVFGKLDKQLYVQTNHALDIVLIFYNGDIFFQEFLFSAAKDTKESHV